MLEECVGGSGEPVEEGHCIEGEGEERARERARDKDLVIRQAPTPADPTSSCASLRALQGQSTENEKCPS